jgi:hypothetical protein
MDDTISREQVIATIDSFNVFESRYDQIKLELMIRELPPAQPEIIRCKDCKYAEYIDDVQTLWCTECGQGRTVAPDDFCSYAERVR